MFEEVLCLVENSDEFGPAVISHQVAIADRSFYPSFRRQATEYAGSSSYERVSGNRVSCFEEQLDRLTELTLSCFELRSRDRLPHGGLRTRRHQTLDGIERDCPCRVPPPRSISTTVMEPSRVVLLTGAGFTKNFGGFLASEMWGRIYNRLSEHPQLQEDMRQSKNFEDFYRQVRDSNGPAEIPRALGLAIFDSYTELDEVLRGWRGDPSSGVSHDALSRFLYRFAGDSTESSFVFTLNQDLFIERHYSNQFDKPLRHPGVRTVGPVFSLHHRSRCIDPLDYLIPELGAEGSELGREFYYVKLHGSYGLHERGEDPDLPGMLIGGQKAQDIERSALLSWYQDLFRQVLRAGETRILVAGYGFGDEHINHELSSAVDEAGLEIHILDPTDPHTLIARLRATPSGSRILSGVRGFWSDPFTKLFTFGQGTGPHLQQLIDHVFG